MRGGGELTPQQRDFQAKVREHVSHFHEFGIDELTAFFDPDDIIGVDNYQRNCDPSVLIQNPLPSDFSDRYDNVAESLKFNTATYEEDLEDQIVTDEVMQRLFGLMRRDRTNLDITSAIRVRRSILVMLWSAEK